MKRYWTLLLAFIIFSSNLSAQIKTFQKDNGGFFAQPSTDGNYYSTMKRYKDGNSYDIYVVKNRKDGSIKWAKTYTAGGSYDSPHSLVATPDSGCIVVGGTYNGIQFYPFIAKFDSLGNVNYAKINGAGYYYDVQNTTNKGIIASGTINGLSLLSKFKKNGTLQWSFTYDSGGINSVIPTLDKGYIATGYKKIAGETQALYFKVDSLGSLKWAKTIGCQYGSYGQGITTAVGGGYIIVGAAGFKQLVHGSQAFICKIDENGSVIWTKYLENTAKVAVTDNDWGNFIKRTLDNNYVIVIMGQLNFQLTNNILKIDPQGNPIWSKVYGIQTMNGNVNQSATVYPTSDNGYIISEWNLYKTDAQGNAGCTQLNSSYNTINAVFSAGDVALTQTAQNNIVDIELTPAAESTTASDIMVTVPKITVDPSGSIKLCAGSSVTLTADGNGFGPYQWSNGAVGTQITVSSTNNFNVTGISSSGCTSISDTVKVVVNPMPVSAKITALGNTTFCNGDSVLLSAPSGDELTYKWQISGFPTTRTTYAKWGTTIAVEVTNKYGCTKTSSEDELVTLHVNFPTTPIVSKSGSTSICKGDSVMLTSSVATSYLWSNGSTTQSIYAKEDKNYTVTITDINGCKATSFPEFIHLKSPYINLYTNKSSACIGDSIYAYTSGGDTYKWSNGKTGDTQYIKTGGSYYVIGQDSDGCKDTSNLVTLNFNSLPIPVIKSDGGNAICQGKSITLSTTVPFIAYTWSNANPFPSITVSQAGSYSVEVTDNNGCKGTSALFTVVTSSSAPPQPSIIRTDTLCMGTSIVLSADKVYSSYNWSDGSTNSTTTSSFGGNYTLTVTDANGCSGTSSSVNVLLHQKPFVFLVSSGAFAFCEGSADTLKANDTFSAYQWSNGSTLPKLIVNNAGSYYLKVTDINGCQNTTNTVNIESHPNPVVSITADGGTDFCNGKSVNLSTAGSYYSYRWSNGSFNPTLNVTQTGNYYLVVSNQYSCKGTSNTIPVTVSPGPSVSISANGNTSFCEGGSVDLVSTGNFPSYLWSSGQNTPNITAATSSNYSITVTDALGCKGTSNTISVIVHPKPTPSIQSSNGFTICEGRNTVLSTMNSFTSYLWTGGSITPTIAIAQQGKYVLKVIDSYGCSGADSVNISVNPTPTANFSFVVNNLQVTFNNSSLNAYQYKWNFGDNSQESTLNSPIHNYLSGNNYNVMLVAFNNSCTDTLKKTVSVLTSVTAIADEGLIKIYPSPNDGKFTIDFVEKGRTPKWVEIYNLIGKKIYRAIPNASTLKVNLVNASKGVYFIKVEGSAQTFKFVIQ
ncbi:MAG: T9SS type A sorting domain-containing protein [Bacteroidales bacterium]|nr:T9SS type A sorting domain-containing protein [Bacteroidales bacterium]